MPRLATLAMLLVALASCGSNPAPPTSVAPASVPIATTTPDAAVPIDAAIADETAIDAATSARDEIVALSRFGFLTIEANRETKVYVDDMLIGETPLLRLPLAPGPHKVALVGPGNQKKQIEIVIEGGKDIEHKITW